MVKKSEAKQTSKIRISLSLDDRRLLGNWTADCAERVLALFEAKAPADTRPREAIEGIRIFACGGKRTVQLRTCALAALAAAREIVCRWPARVMGRTRLSALFYKLDSGLRG